MNAASFDESEFGGGRERERKRERDDEMVLGGKMGSAFDVGTWDYYFLPN